MPYGGAAPAGSAMTARRAPRRSRSARIRRPERRDAAAGGIRSTAVPPSRRWARACWTQASSDSVRAGNPYSQRGSYASSSWPQLRSLNGGWQSTASAASCGKASARRVSPPRREGAVVVGVGVQGEPQCGERGEVGVGLLRVQGGRAVDGAQQGAGARGGVEDSTGGLFPGLHQGGHEFGESGRCECVLAWVGVQLAAEQELEGLPGPGLRGHLRGAPEQRNGRKQFGAAGSVNSPSGYRGGPEAVGEHVLESEGQHTGHRLVRHSGDLPPGGGAVAPEQQGATGVDQGGDRAGRVSGELLPDPFTERDLGEFPLVTQPLLDLGQGEGRARLGATDGLGEVGMAAAPVTDGGPPHAREPGDPGRGHLCRGRVLRH